MSAGGSGGGQQWPRRPSDPYLEMLVPRVFGAVPTLFGAPLAESAEEIKGADVAFLGVPWSTPIAVGRTGSAIGNYFGTNLTPGQFRMNSLKYSGYLPELDLDVFERIKIVDCGDAEILKDHRQLLERVEAQVGEILDAGAIPITMGGNSGPGTWSVVKAVQARAGGPTAVVDFDAHHDNLPGDWEDDDPKAPRWSSTWARRILSLPHVDPERFYFLGLRGPRNDRDTLPRFLNEGVKREHIYTYREIKQARRAGFDAWAENLARQIMDGTSKVWVHVDPDVLDISANPHWTDEPLGMHADEVIEVLYQLGKAAGRERFAGLSFVGVPWDAQTLHYTCLYMIVYLLAGIATSEG